MILTGRFYYIVRNRNKLPFVDFKSDYTLKISNNLTFSIYFPEVYILRAPRTGKPADAARLLRPLDRQIYMKMYSS